MVVLWCCILSNKTQAQLSITNNQTANNLAQALVSSGVTISNPTLTCAGAANGLFTSSGSNLGIDEGVLLTTGSATAVANPEPGTTSYNNSMPGDPALTSLSGASTTVDACILEFDVVPVSDTIKFQYVFGSEEYINSVCGPYNDAFAFFISGPGISGQDNMAQVPGTNIPVAVNSINNGIPGQYSGGSLANCIIMGAGSPFTTYYNNNQNGTTVAYRGLTTVLTASHAVQPCSTYHLKLTIADAQNGLYDSGVFLKAGSLQSASLDIAATGAVVVNDTPSVYKGCTSGNFVFTRSSASSQPITLNYIIGGTAVNGTDYTLIPSTITLPANTAQVSLPITGLVTGSSSQQTVTLYLMSEANCSGQSEITDSATIKLLPTPHAEINTNDTTVCNGDAINISVNASDQNFQYSWTPATGLNNTNIPNPVATPTSAITYTMTATIPSSGCAASTDMLHVGIADKPQSVVVGNDIYTCSSPFEINPIITPDLSSFTYSWHSTSGYNSDERILNSSSLQPSLSGDFVFTVSSELCGSVSDTVKIEMVDAPLPPNLEDNYKFCTNEPIRFLNADEALRWYRDMSDTAPITTMVPPINNIIEGTYVWYVSQYFDGCESDKKKVVIDIVNCCGIPTLIPTAFTPNGDGLNDYFEIKSSQRLQVIRVDIFNRWGELIFEGKDGDVKWDGTFKGKKVEVGSYFYNIVTECESTGLTQQYKGTITVIN